MTSAIPFVNTILILLLTFPAEAWPTRAHKSDKRFNFIMLMATRLKVAFVVSKVEEIMRSGEEERRWEVRRWRGGGGKTFLSRVLLFCPSSAGWNFWIFTLHYSLVLPYLASCRLYVSDIWQKFVMRNKPKQSQHISMALNEVRKAQACQDWGIMIRRRRASKASSASSCFFLCCCCCCWRQGRTAIVLINAWLNSWLQFSWRGNAPAAPKWLAGAKT